MYYAQLHFIERRYLYVEDLIDYHFFLSVGLIKVDVFVSCFGVEDPKAFEFEEPSGRVRALHVHRSGDSAGSYVIFQGRAPFSDEVHFCLQQQLHI